MRIQSCSCFIVFPIIWIIEGQSIQKNGYVNKGSFADILCDDGKLYRTVTRSLLKCAKGCSIQPNCSSFFYNNNGTCQFHKNVVLTSANCFGLIESRYYIPKDYSHNTEETSTLDYSIHDFNPVTTTTLTEETSTLVVTTQDYYLDTTTQQKDVISTLKTTTQEYNPIISTKQTEEMSTIGTTIQDYNLDTTTQEETSTLGTTTQDNNVDTTTQQKEITSTLAAQCNVGWMSLGYGCYQVTPGGSSKIWAEARDHCNIMNGYLAAMETAEENQIFKDYLSNLGSSDYFIGGNDLETEGIFKWIHSGDIVNLPDSGGFQDWFPPNQPDNGNSNANQHCMIFYGSAGHVWNDVTCTYARKFICESDPV